MKPFRTIYFCKFLILIFLFTAGIGLSACVIKPPPIESHFNRGVELYDRGKYSEAIDEYKLALRVNPDNNFARYNLAVIYQDQGKQERAAKLYREILRHIEDTNSRINLASIYINQGKEDEAFDQLRKAAEANPDSPNPPSILGEYLEQRNRWDKAEKNYLKALMVEDKHAATHFRLGRLYLKQRKYEKGKSHLKKSVELEPEDPLFLEALGDEYERKNQVFDAISMLERVSVMQPDRAEIYTRLGDLYKKKQYYRLAVSRYWDALAIDSENTYVHRVLKEIFEILIQKEKEKLELLEKQNLTSTSQKDK